MTAIITEKFKTLILNNLDADLEDPTSNYYVAVGNPDDWDSADNAPDPENTAREIRNAQLNTMSVKKVETHSFVIPRYTWSLGAIYSAYNDNATGHPIQSYYVITDENKVYVCLEQGRDTNGNAVTSTVKPTSISTKPQKLGDGYVWKFLYSVGSARAAKFISANFMPVDQYLTSDSADPIDHREQVGIAAAAVQGQIVGYTVTNGGANYTSTPTVNITGDGSGAKATAVMTAAGDAVAYIQVADSSGDLTHGTNYTWADISFSGGGGGTGAAARPVLAPYAGFGYDPRIDLRSSAMMFVTSPDGDEGANWVVGNDFRQVLLVRNPRIADSDGLFTAETGSALVSMRMNSISSNFTADKTIEGNTSGARGIVATTDSDQVFYIQNETTGFTQFTDGETVNETNGSGQGIADSAAVSGDVERISGDVIFIDNRAAVQRATDQTEDIKIIIQI